ncbi:MBL fold metallo-hydrolase [Sphingomonas astaxanthinifaciens]|uniref:MBL fold hydrolase n=1 Tax=Sphingomonas astaxanthinifaciens DSM 22298 TaxID=1123267 RepID=A0ABQ5Z3V6_9SPHN|nr:MBL fold metallo-hydrolase [Sphingomonas astaxanthinifaciens]GLR47473.1 MBL fold hydrolase [Sphingomonas astaxanthinifaciens DSM 22298]
MTHEPGRLYPLADDLARLLAPNPSPYTGEGTWVHLIGTDRLAVLDPGPADPDHIAAILAAIAGRPVDAILVTHTHRDHSPGAAPLRAATGAPLWGCAPLVIPGSQEAGFDADYAPDRVLTDGERVALGGTTIEAVHTPGHTSNHLCFAAGERLFSGDHVMGWSTTVVIPPDGHMGDYMKSLAKLQARPETIYHPAHGEPVADPQRLLRGLLTHRVQRERQLLRLVEEQAGDVAALTARAYPALDPRLVRAAEATALAHLITLEERGALSRVGDTWKV